MSVTTRFFRRKRWRTGSLLSFQPAGDLAADVRRTLAVKPCQNPRIKRGDSKFPGIFVELVAQELFNLARYRDGA